MDRKRLCLVGLMVCLAIAIPALAQFGHPLKGSWSGEWRENASTEHRILLDQMGREIRRERGRRYPDGYSQSRPRRGSDEEHQTDAAFRRRAQRGRTLGNPL